MGEWGGNRKENEGIQSVLIKQCKSTRQKAAVILEVCPSQ